MWKVASWKENTLQETGDFKNVAEIRRQKESPFTSAPYFKGFGLKFQLQIAYTA